MTADQWIQVVAILLPITVLVVGSHLRTASRIAVIETRLDEQDKRRTTAGQHADDRVALAMIRHCQTQQERCPAYRDWERWAEDSSVRVVADKP